MVGLPPFLMVRECEPLKTWLSRTHGQGWKSEKMLWETADSIIHYILCTLYHCVTITSTIFPSVEHDLKILLGHIDGGCSNQEHLSIGHRFKGANTKLFTLFCRADGLDPAALGGDFHWMSKPKRFRCFAWFCPLTWQERSRRKESKSRCFSEQSTMRLCLSL